MKGDARATRIGENGIDAVIHEALDHDIRAAGEFRGCRSRCCRGVGDGGHGTSLLQDWQGVRARRVRSARTVQNMPVQRVFQADGWKNEAAPTSKVHSHATTPEFIGQAEPPCRSGGVFVSRFSRVWTFHQDRARPPWGSNRRYWGTGVSARGQFFQLGLANDSTLPSSET